MEIINVKDLPVAENVCAQVLREVEKQPQWSLAHVTMNPLATSLLQNHHRMNEVYVTTKGFGRLGLAPLGQVSWSYREVTAGSVHEIRSVVPHLLQNKSSSHLEHLVFALPSFDPADVHLLEPKNLPEITHPLSLPEPQDCFDGARIIPYAYPDLDLSIAFGWVINDITRQKKPHYHQETWEFAYVVEGKGFIHDNGARRAIKAGDWISITPETEHGFLNESPEDLVVVCVCSPAFKMADVHYYS